MGSSVFHPKSSRVARMASGGRYGLAQSLFQVGGNIGSALGPLLAAFIVVPHGQRSLAWFSPRRCSAMLVLSRSAAGISRARAGAAGAEGARRIGRAAPLPQRSVLLAIAVLVALLFSKNFYIASLGSYYTFYLIDKFHVSVQSAQMYPVPLPAAVGGRHADRRAARRPHRPEAGDLVLHPGRAALHPGAAAMSGCSGPAC